MTRREEQNSDVRTSVEEEMAQLERQEEEFHDALEGSGEDVCRHGGLVGSVNSTPHTSHVLVESQ